MISNNDLKYYSSLLQKKCRLKEKKFIAEGRKIVEEGLENNISCEVVFLSKNFAKTNFDFINKLTQQNHHYEIIKDKEFERLSDTVNPQGVAAIFYYRDKTMNIKTELVTALENISDPGNVGTIIRNCDWFGVKEIILSENCSEVYNPKTIRASMGSIFHLKLFEGIKLIQELSSLKKNGYKIYSTHLKGKNLYEVKTGVKSVIVFSNESSGPTKELINISDEVISIPKYGMAESLNVASASAVVLSQLCKE